MSSFLREDLEKMVAYTPGEQPRDRAYIKLNTNESPYPPSPAVTAAVNAEAAASLRLYCDPTAKALREALAACYGVSAREVFVSNGSDEILNFAFMAYGQGGVAFADITYGFYEVFAELYGIPSEIIPLREDFTLPTEAFLDKGKLIVLASPNAPTGIELHEDEVIKILESNKRHVVVLDSAYVDFGGRSLHSLCKKYKNLLCVYTFSKSRSMAGARLGFAIADESLIADLEKIKYATNPYNVNSLTQRAGVAALSENDYYKRNAERIMATREKTKSALTALGFSVLPSKANFLFARHPHIGGEALYLALKAKGILIRHFKRPRIEDYIRITIGSEEEMECFLYNIKQILGELS